MFVIKQKNVSSFPKSQGDFFQISQFVQPFKTQIYLININILIQKRNKNNSQHDESEPDHFQTHYNYKGQQFQ